MAKILAKSRNKKRTLYTVLILIILAVAFFIFRLLNPSVGFKYYEPSYLPPNVSIKSRRIRILPGSTAVEQDFRTVDWGYTIEEYKADRPIGTAQQNYDPTSTKPTCSIMSSPENQQYRTCHWIDYHRIDVHEVTFIKNGTFIQSQLPTTLDESISIKEIGEYVDSFHQKSTIGLPVVRSNF